jgi:hypothetical protein
MRMKVTGIRSAGNCHTIVLEPDVADLSQRDADGITMVELHCGNEAGPKFAMGGKHEFYIGSAMAGSYDPDEGRYRN